MYKHCGVLGLLYFSIQSSLESLPKKSLGWYCYQFCTSSCNFISLNYHRTWHENLDETIKTLLFIIGHSL